LLDVSHSDLFLLELILELVSFSELVGHLIFVLSSFFLKLLQLLFNSDLKDLNLLEILLPLLLLDLESCIGCLRVLELTLLEPQVILHFANLLSRWKFVLSDKVIVHVLQQLVDEVLVLANLLLVLDLLLLKLLHEFIDFLFLLVKDFVLLCLISVTLFLLQVLLDLLNASLVVFCDFLSVQDLLVELLDFIVVHLNSVKESLSSFSEWKVELISLKFQLIFL
jgi:hypothetical protein